MIHTHTLIQCNGKQVTLPSSRYLGKEIVRVSLTDVAKTSITISFHKVFIIK